jgi:hypothetical protein
MYVSNQGDQQPSQNQNEAPVARTLSARGAAKLAQRANALLDKDELVAILVNKQIGDVELLREVYARRICNRDVPIVRKLREAGAKLNVPEWIPDFEPLMQFSCDKVVAEQPSCAN